MNLKIPYARCESMSSFTNSLNAQVQQVLSRAAFDSIDPPIALKNRIKYMYHETQMIVRVSVFNS